MASLDHGAAVCYAGDLRHTVTAGVQLYSERPDTWDHCRFADESHRPLALTHRFYEEKPSCPKPEVGRLCVRGLWLVALNGGHADSCL